MTFEDTKGAKPILGQRGREAQHFGTLIRRPLGLSDEALASSVESLNRLLADSLSIRDLYKKHHWQVAGPTFYALHLLLDKHAGEQTEIVDALAERVQTLGGIALAMSQHVAEVTRVEMPPRGREELPVQLSRLLEAHEHILIEARATARRAAETGDDGTNDLVVSEVVRINEAQVWFLSAHLVDTPLVHTR